MLIALLLSLSRCDDIEEIENLLQSSNPRGAFERSNSLIQKIGQLDADPKLFFLRGRSCSKISKFDQAIKDMNHFLSSGSGNISEQQLAFKIRGEAHLRLGDFDEALKDATLSNETTLKSLVTRAQHSWNTVLSYSNQGNYSEAFSKIQNLMKTVRFSPRIFYEAASLSLKLSNETSFLDITNQAIAKFPNDAPLLELRGRFFFCNNDLPMAIRHFRACSSVTTSGNCTSLLRSANNCQSLIKNAKASIDSKKGSAAISSLDTAENTTERFCPRSSALHLSLIALRSRALTASDNFSGARELLDKYLAENEAPELLIARGDVEFESGNWDEAMEIYQKARKAADGMSIAKEVEAAIERTSKKQDEAKNVDFYKVLNLSRGASEEEVKRAYKKAVVAWHPDRFRDPAMKKKAEREMKNINRAYDVLSDQSKRQMYDMGQDPDNPGISQNGHGFNAGPGFTMFNIFQNGGGFQFFPGGGQRIQFHF